jgi:hypothetical protein
MYSSFKDSSSIKAGYLCTDLYLHLIIGVVNLKRLLCTQYSHALSCPCFACGNFIDHPLRVLYQGVESLLGQSSV